MNSLILATTLFIPHEYTTLDAFDRTQLPEQEYNSSLEWYENLSDVEFLSISYMSDGLIVKGIIGKPKNIDHTLPVIIYARGGSDDSGKITVKTLKDKFYFWIKQGYVVVASQYRGNDGGQGKDELGGADVADIFNLYKAVHELPYVNTNNVSIIGHSRGGMMALMALHQQLPVKAAVLTAAVTDLFALDILRPDLIPLFNRMIPGMPENREYEYTQRSAVCWADAINVPLLIFHGDADTVIPVSQAHALADALEKHNKKYKLIIYPDGDHTLSAYQSDINKHALHWFEENSIK